MTLCPTLRSTKSLLVFSFLINMISGMLEGSVIRYLKSLGTLNLKTVRHLAKLIQDFHKMSR